MTKESLKLIFLCFSTTVGLLLTLNYAVQKADEAQNSTPLPDQPQVDKPAKEKKPYVRKSYAS